MISKASTDKEVVGANTTSWLWAAQTDRCAWGLCRRKAALARQPGTARADANSGGGGRERVDPGAFVSFFRAAAVR